MFAGTHARFKPVIDFSSAQDGVDGVIWKAGLQSSAATAAGIGVNGTLTDSGGLIDFSLGGASTNAANSATNIAISIPSANQEGFKAQGRIQLDIHRDSLIGVVTENNTKLAMLNVSNAVAGPYYRTTLNGAAGQANTFDYGAIDAQVAWVTNIGSSPFETWSEPKFIVDDSLGEWVTLTISWTGGFYTHLIDGRVVSRGKHVAFATTPTKVQVSLQATELADRTPIRNLILSDFPAPDHRAIPGRKFPTVITIGHSFWNTAGGAGVYGYDSNERIGSLKHLTININKACEDAVGPMRFLNLAHDGSVRSAATVITGHGEAMTPGNATYDWAGASNILNRYLRWRPDFALLMCHNSDTNTTTVNTQLTVILDALKAAGCVPIVIREQNRDRATPTAQDRTAVDTQVQTTVTTWRAANGGDNACGIVDCWTPTGGSTVNADYVETATGTLHPSLDAGPIYGAAVAPVLSNLMGAPPSWSNWANR